MKRILFCAILFWVTPAAAQFIAAPYAYWDLKESRLIPVSDGNFIGAVYEKVKTSALNYNKFRKKITTVLYDKNLGVLKTNPLLGGSNEFSDFFANTLQSNGKVWVTYIEPAKKNAVGNFYAMEINSSSLEAGTPQTIALESDVSETVHNMSNWNIFIASSPSTRKHVLFADTDRKDFFISGLDENLHALWKTKLELPGYKTEDIISTVIDDEGTIFISCFNKNKDASLFSIKDGKIISEKLIQIPGGQIHHLTISHSKNLSEIVVSGSVAVASINVNNVFTTVVKKQNLAVAAIEKMELNKDILDIIDKNGLGSSGKKNPGIYSYSVTVNAYNELGDKPVLILECLNTIQTASTIYGVTGSLIIINFNKNISTPMYHIPRYGVLARGHYDYEYSAQICNNKLAITYVDNAANLNRKPTDKYDVMKGTRNAAYFVVTFDSLGNTASKIHSLVRNETSDIDLKRTLMSACE